MKLRFLHRRPTPADLAPVRVSAPAAPKPGSGPFPLRAELTPPPAPAITPPAPRFAPGRYVIVYDQFRPYGVPAPALITIIADSAADLAEQVGVDIAPFLGSSHRIEVTVDMVVSGGTIRCGTVTGTFTFTRGGAR
jgi:hypothetical protein